MKLIYLTLLFSLYAFPIYCQEAQSTKKPRLIFSKIKTFDDEPIHTQWFTEITARTNDSEKNEVGGATFYSNRCSIIGFNIFSKFRGHGYTQELLEEVLKEAKISQCDRVYNLPKSNLYTYYKKIGADVGENGVSYTFDKNDYLNL